MDKNLRIRIKKTPGEWNLLAERVKAKDKKEIRRYVNSAIIKLIHRYKECPSCFDRQSGKIKEKQFRIDNETHTILTKISEKMGRPMSSIIDDLFFIPLLSIE